MEHRNFSEHQLMIVRLLVTVLFGGSISGCGRDLPDLVPVSGRVQFEGGPPPTTGLVDFLPVEAAGGLPMRPGSGQFDANGYFQSSSFNGTKGLVPGRYHIRIECFAYQPKPVPGDYEKANHVPADYQPPDVVIESGQRSVSDLLFNIPKKK